MKYIIKTYDHELLKIHITGEWESESAMLNDLMKNGYKPIEWWTVCA